MLVGALSSLTENVVLEPLVKLKELADVTILPYTVVVVPCVIVTLTVLLLTLGELKTIVPLPTVEPPTVTV